MLPRVIPITFCLNKNSRILDIGGGDGEPVLAGLIDPNIERWVLDIANLNQSPNFIKGNIEEFSFAEETMGTFDSAVIMEVLEHLHDPVATLKKIRNVTDELLITVPNEWLWPSQLLPFKPPCDDFHRAFGHRRYYTKDLIEKHLEEGGWEIQSMMDIQYNGWAFLLVRAKSNPDVEVKHHKEYRNCACGLYDIEGDMPCPWCNYNDGKA